RPRWRIPAGGTVTPGAISAEEIADLEATARLLRQHNLRRRASSLEALAAKLRAALPSKAQLQLEPDVEALLQAEGLAMRPGPRPLIRTDVIDTIRLAIKQGRMIYLAYRSRGSGRASGRMLEPYGFLLGNRHYLVGMAPDRHPGDARLFALSNIGKVKVLDRPFQRDPAFSLEQFARRAFGVFQEEPRDIAWRFTPDAAAAAREYLFHPSQVVEPQPDGSLVVRFRAGGLLEMCWHLYSWGASVEVLTPPELKQLMKGAARHRRFVVDGAAVPS
ncbi:WYL domain-containing protein, partial [Vineibacter terrae]|uniref:helix-turn-helix transcriptional regulator n=1 Tax=Vineibacter terrae TaxID=2586908 RepID=UPI002E36AE61